MEILISIIIATFAVSLFSFIGIVTLFFNKKNLQKELLILVSLSAGTMIGGAFFHLIPEASKSLNIENLVLFTLGGFILFFIIEKIFHWRHCHEGECEIHSFAKLNLFGDGIHNFIDGFVIASSFMINSSIGWITTLAIMVHEIPQEIGDFGVLLHGGFEKKKALLFNFLSGVIAIIGGITGYILFSFVEFNYAFLLCLTAGGFIYISASDLIPEMKKELSIRKSLINLGVFLLGIILMFVLRFLNFN